MPDNSKRSTILAIFYSILSSILIYLFMCFQCRKSRDRRGACCVENFFNVKVTGMRCSIRRLKSSHVADAPHESSSDVSPVGISDLFPELLTIIFSYLEVRDKGCAAQVMCVV